jgi:hypothetical protein
MENCRGFLSQQWKCGICDSKICNKCNEEKVEDHLCNPDNIASMELLNRDTKPCPKCGTMIFRISGCEQMFCTHCNTGFNWRTGRVEQVVHNPHYFEWLRRNGNAIPRNPADIPCQQDLTHRVYINIRSLLTENYTTHPKCNSTIDLLTFVIRNAIHLRLTILTRYAPVDRVQRNEELRVQYMLHNVSEDDFKTTLQRNEKKYNKHQEIYHVLEVLSNTITEIVFRFQTRLTNTEPLDDILPILDEINVIVVYVNNCLRDIGKAYSCKTLCFSDKIEVRSV